VGVAKDRRLELTTESPYPIFLTYIGNQLLVVQEHSRLHPLELLRASVLVRTKPENVGANDLNPGTTAEWDELDGPGSHGRRVEDFVRDYGPAKLGAQGGRPAESRLRLTTHSGLELTLVYGKRTLQSLARRLGPGDKFDFQVAPGDGRDPIRYSIANTTSAARIPPTVEFLEGLVAELKMLGYPLQN
jgi:hypothetical protein